MEYDKIIFNERPFLVILGRGTNFWVHLEVSGPCKFLFEFWNFLSMGFLIVYDMTILNEHPFWIICGLGTDLWTGQEVSGAT